MSSVVINEKDELVKLDNIRIRDREMIPEVVITTNKVVETMNDPNYINEQGVKENRVTGVMRSIIRTSTVTLHPEEYYEIEKKRRHAKENGSKIKKTGKEKGTDR